MSANQDLEQIAKKPINKLRLIEGYTTPEDEKLLRELAKAIENGSIESSNISPLHILNVSSGSVVRNTLHIVGAGLGLATIVEGCAIIQPYQIVYPTNVSVPPIRAEYGARSNMCGKTRSSPHTGLDIVAERGYPVIAAGDGEVILAGWVSAGGNRVMIYHGVDDDGKHIYSRYSHMDELNVKEGVVTLEPVKRGQKIGTIGDTGSEAGTCGPHLHYEVYALNYSLIQGKKVSRFSQDDTSNPHDFWLRGNNSPPDKIIIPPFIKGREYPTRPVRLTYPVPCK